MTKITADKIQDLIDLEETTNGGVKNNKLANFSYTEVAYENNEAAGVDSYDSSQEQNIPNPSPVATETNQTVLDRGFRSQGASLSRMLTNHFFGRTSYNLNKIHDWFTDYLKTFKSFLNRGIWNLEKNTANEISDFDGVVEPGTYKGKDFTGISSESLPDWFMQSEHQLADFGYWTLIVEEGVDFKRQVLHYTRKSNGVFELGQYTAIRTMTLQPSGEIDSYGTWTSKSVEADHALAADNATEATHATNADEATHATNADEATHATNADNLGDSAAANYTLKSELTDGTVKPQISKTLEDVGNAGTNWGVDYNGNSGTTARNWWCAFDDSAKNIVPVNAPTITSLLKKTRVFLYSHRDTLVWSSSSSSHTPLPKGIYFVIDSPYNDSSLLAFYADGSSWATLDYNLTPAYYGDSGKWYDCYCIPL